MLDLLCRLEDDSEVDVKIQGKYYPDEFEKRSVYYLSKLKKILAKPREQLSDLEFWRMIILSGDDPQIKEVLSQRAEELDEHKEEMTMISALLNRLSLRRNNWAYQFSAEKWEHDWTSRWHTGIDNARKEGIAIGEVQGRVEGEVIGEHNAKL